MSSEKQKDELLDEFKKAAIENAAKGFVEENIIKKEEEQLALAEQIASSNLDTQWEKLRECISGEFAERFIHVHIHTGNMSGNQEEIIDVTYKEEEE